MIKIEFEGRVQEYGVHRGRVYIPKDLREFLNIRTTKVLQALPITRYTINYKQRQGLRFFKEFQKSYELEGPIGSSFETGKRCHYEKVDGNSRIILRKTSLDICSLSLFDMVVLIRRHDGFELWKREFWQKLNHQGYYYEYKKRKDNLFIAVDEDSSIIFDSKDIKYLKNERLKNPSDSFVFVDCFPKCFLFHLDIEGKYKEALGKNWSEFITLSLEPIKMAKEINLSHISKDKIQIEFDHIIINQGLMIYTGKRIYAIFKKQMPSFYLLEDISEEIVNEEPLFLDLNTHKRANLITEKERVKKLMREWYRNKK